MPKPRTHQQLTGVAVALWLVCVALPALGEPPACLPIGGCLGFPNADAESGKFINVTRGLSSLGDVGTGQRVFNISLEIPAARTDFELAIFDGELGGRWDRWSGGSANLDNVIFKLYRDPDVEGSTCEGQAGPPCNGRNDLLYSWPAASMPDDAWCTLNPDYPLDPVTNPVCASGSIPQDAGAFNLDRNAHIYHLVADWATTNRTNEQNNFKVVVEGQPFLLAGSTIGFQGFKYQHSNGTQLGDATLYDGRFGFKFFVPEGTSSLVFYDGDADFANDTDDPNSDTCTPNTAGCPFPQFQTSPFTIAQGANPGVPPDDLTSSDPAFDDLIGAFIRVEPSVFYRILPPAGSDWPPEGAVNADVSGDKEWEFYGLGEDIADCVAPGSPAQAGCDATVPSIPAGLYTWLFEGVDGFNTIFLHTDHDVFPELASIGNTVWFDADGDGFWDDNPFDVPVGNEPGIANVQVNLYRDVNQNEALDAGDDFVDFTCTDAGGQYLFADLPLDKYIVEIAQQNFATTGSACTNGAPGALVGLTQTLDRSTEPGDHFNRTTPWPVDLPTNINYSRADFGFVENPPECDVLVEKTCEVQPPPVADFNCKDAKPIDILEMTWVGTAAIQQPVRVRAWRGSVGSALLGDIDNVALNDSVTVVGFAGAPNDVVWELFSAGTNTKIGESTFHLSCSDPDMDGPEDIGKLQGDGKGKTGFVNGWRLVNMVGANGIGMLPPEPLPSTDCTAVPVPVPNCASEGKPTTLTFTYTAEDCSASANTQDPKRARCDDLDALPVLAFILISDKSDPFDTKARRFFSGAVAADSDFVVSAPPLSKEFRADTYYHLFDQELSAVDARLLQSGQLHTSCSQPLAVGDQFGSLLLKGFNGAEAIGSLVTYRYRVTNLTADAVTVTEVTDNLLGAIDDCEGPLAGGDSVECSLLAELTPSFTPVTNVVDVIANAGGPSCIAKDQATVRFSGCTLEGAASLKVDDDKIEWQVTNIGANAVTIGRLLLTWPIDHGNLKKVKLGKDTIFEGSIAPPFADISSFIDKLDKRQIKAGKREKLRFEFDAKLKGTTASEYEITVNMDEYCSVTFSAGQTPSAFTCAKPIDALTMIWTDAQARTIDVTAWKGAVGSANLGTQTVAPGEAVTFSGFAGSPNDVVWELFDAFSGDKIGESTFHLSCSDKDMDGPEDCGKLQGDGKGRSGFINTWLLEGMVDSKGVLDCSL